MDDSKEIATLVFAAECYESDAEKHFDSGTGRKLISSSLFESAIHAYRKVPVKYRGQYSVEEKIKKLRHKLQEAGENTLHQMGTISTPIDGVDEMVRLARDHVSGKSSEYEALFYLSGICSFPEFSSLRKEEKERMSKYFFSSFFGAVQYSSDGRVIAKTPAAGLDDEQESFVLAVYDQMIRSFSLEVNLKVSAIIVPALKQVLMEHTFSKKFIFEMCSNSPIVPRPNVHLISHAIWLGLESDFSTAIYLVAPQVESIIRKKLKEKNIHTTHFDKNGIESEYGLSTLLDKEESLDIFSEDQVFVLKALFTSSVGANLRNEVAHGLLTDASAYGPAPIYAWWVLLRMIVDSIINPEK